MSNLAFNEHYTQKVIPFLKTEYFKDPVERELFLLIDKYVKDYNSLPSQEALLIEMDSVKLNDEQLQTLETYIQSMHIVENTSIDWLTEKTEEFCKEKALANAIIKSAEILSGKDKTLDKHGISKLINDAIAVSFDTHIGHDYFEDAEARYEAYHAESNKIPFDIDVLNLITNGGLSRKTLTILMGGVHVGKAQPNDTIIPTPNGYRRFGDLKIGDAVFGSNGRATTIKGIYPQGIKEIYEIEFADGRKTRCCKEHLWQYSVNGKESWHVGSLEEMMSVKGTKYIPIVQPIEYDEKNYFINPYVIGALIGDGGLTGKNIKFTNPDTEVIERFRNLLPEGFMLYSNGIEHRIRSVLYKTSPWETMGLTRDQWNHQGNRVYNSAFKFELERLDLMGKYSHEKFIPKEYLIGSKEQRLELLRALIDTDGNVTSSGSVQFSSTSKQLILDVSELVNSLGGKVSNHQPQKGSYRDKHGQKQGCRISYRITIKLFSNDIVSYVHRKQVRVSYINRIRPRLAIKSIRAVEYSEAMCITVDALDHLYVTNDYIVTHNTALMCSLAASNLRLGNNVLYISMEMSEIKIAQRVDAHLLDRTMDEVLLIEKQAFLNSVKRVKSQTVGRLKVREYPTSQAGSANFRFVLSELKLKENFVPDIIYIDYLNICTSSSFKQGKADLYSYVKAISEELRGLAVEFNLPIVTATQFNREGFSSSDPGMENVSESFGTTATGDLILAIVRTPELDAMKQIKIIQLKNRESNTSNLKSFVVGIEIEKMKLYNADDIRLTPRKKAANTDDDDKFAVVFDDEMKEKMKFDRSMFGEAA